MDIFTSLLNFTNYIGNLPISFLGSATSAIGDTFSCLLNNGFSSGCTALPNNFFSEVAGVFTDPISFFSTGLAHTIQYLWYFLPDGGAFPTIIHTAAQTLGGAMANLAFILPVHDLITILFLIFTIRATLILYYLTKTVIGLIRGIPVNNPFQGEAGPNEWTVTYDQGPNRGKTFRM